MSALRSFRWPAWLPARVFAAVGLTSVLLMALLLLVTSRPEPTAPPEYLFVVPDLASSASAGVGRPNGNDFIARPLFSSSRRPPVPIPVEVVAPPTPSAPSPEIELTDVTLVGVFESGATQGIVVRLADGGRERVLKGASLDGWTLQSVGSRSARLSAPGGNTAVLRMAFAEVRALPPARPPATGLAREPASADNGATLTTAEDNGNSSTSMEQNAPPAVNPEPISFGSIYRQRYQQNESEDQKAESEAPQ